MKWALMMLVFTAEPAFRESDIVVRDPAGTYCKDVSPGAAKGVILGRVFGRDGGPVPLVRLEAFGVARRADGGLRVSEPSVATGGVGGEFFLPMPNGEICHVRFASSDFEERIVRTECSARACLDVYLDSPLKPEE
jgi:hypothetical protein